MSGDWMLALVLGVGPVVFFLPTLIAFCRDVDGKGLVFLVNLLGLVSALAGWVCAMFMAFRLPKLPPKRWLTAQPAASRGAGFPSRDR